MSSRPPKPANETFTARLKRWARHFDASVARLIGRLEPEWRRRLAILMGVCAVVSVAVGGIVHLVMQSHGTLDEDDSPFGSGLVIAACFGYVAFKALTYKEPPLAPEEQRQRDIRRAWKQQRSLDERKPWPQFMAWPEPRATEVAVLVIRRGPDGTFDTELYDTIAGDSTAEDGAELMWRARAHAEQAEVDAIAEYELTQDRRLETIVARQDAERRARDGAVVAAKTAREADELVAAQARDQRTEAQGLADAMRHTARTRR